jgi:hypothetical protein
LCPAPVSIADGLEAPVLDLQHQDAAGGVEDQEVGMLMARADGDVVPAEVVIFQQGAKALGEAAFAGHGGSSASPWAGEEGGHGGIIAEAGN